jgi:hypothetical protein
VVVINRFVLYKHPREMNIFFKKILKIRKPVFVADIISSVVLILFLYAAISKLNEYHSFYSVLKQSPLLHRFAGIIARLLPITEIFIALLLFIPGLRPRGLYASFLLLIAFTIYLLWMVVFSPNLPCSCGGVIKFLSWWQHIFLNLFFILLSWIGIVLYKSDKNKFITVPP